PSPLGCRRSANSRAARGRATEVMQGGARRHGRATCAVNSCAPAGARSNEATADKFCPMGADRPAAAHGFHDLPEPQWASGGAAGAAARRAVAGSSDFVVTVHLPGWRLVFLGLVDAAWRPGRGR